jgi:hypothetical protein
MTSVIPYWGTGGITSPFFTSALVGGERSVSHHGRFTPGEIALPPRYSLDRKLGGAQSRI